MSGPLSSLFLLSAAGLVAGLVAALRATRRPRERARYEIAAGLLLTGGLFLIGLGLPVFR